MEKKHYQLLILGSGPAGCTAAIYAARANLNLAMIAGLEPGGQLTKTSKIANWPGEPEEISGLLLMEKMTKQVQNFKVAIYSDVITKADLTLRPLVLRGEATEYICDALIIATGATAKFLGLPSEAQYLGRGVSTCAVCDGFFYKNQEMVVVGGGNTMAAEALYLAKIASRVTVIHRREELRAEEWLIQQIKNTPNIQLALNCVVTEICGDAAGVTGVVILDHSSDAIKELPARGVFIAIGHQPNTELFSRQLVMENNYIKTGYQAITATSVSGVFAAGDVVAESYHQAIVAAGAGCVAALDAKNFLSTMK